MVRKIVLEEKSILRANEVRLCCRLRKEGTFSLRCVQADIAKQGL